MYVSNDTLGQEWLNNKDSRNAPPSCRIRHPKAQRPPSLMYYTARFLPAKTEKRVRLPHATTAHVGVRPGITRSQGWR